MALPAPAPVPEELDCEHKQQDLADAIFGKGKVG